MRNVAHAIVLAIFCAGCHADTPTVSAPVIDPYNQLVLNDRSIVMSLVAPYDTIQLRATAYTAGGVPLTALGTPTYTVSDTSLTVSPTGLVTAKTVTAGSYVVARVSDVGQNITRVDTAFITVTANTAPQKLASLSLHPAPGDSAKIAIADNNLVTSKSLFVTTTGTNGENLSSMVPVRFSSSDSSIATVGVTTGSVTGYQVGKTVITATTTWYGVTKSDTLTMTIGYPVFFQWGVKLQQMAVTGQYGLRYTPTDFTIGVGGIVAIQSQLNTSLEGKTVDVIFDDPTAAQPVPYPTDSVLGVVAEPGNIAMTFPIVANDTSILGLFHACVPYFSTFQPPIVNICAAARYFPRAGRYTWHSKLWGYKGTITVQQP